EPCVGVREDGDEASVGEGIGQPLGRENQSPGADAVSSAEGNTNRRNIASACRPQAQQSSLSKILLNIRVPWEDQDHATRDECAVQPKADCQRSSARSTPAPRLSSSLPASIFERSRTSLMRLRRWVLAASHGAAVPAPPRHYLKNPTILPHRPHHDGRN